MDKKKLRYAILKQIYKGESPLDEGVFGVDEESFDKNIRFLHNEGYIEGVYYSEGRPELYSDCVELTEKGERYLEENNILAKGYKGLKELKDWIK